MYVYISSLYLKWQLDINVSSRYASNSVKEWIQNLIKARNYHCLSHGHEKGGPEEDQRNM